MDSRQFPAQKCRDNAFEEQNKMKQTKKTTHYHKQNNKQKATKESSPEAFYTTDSFKALTD